MPLTVKEKEHWKQRVEKNIDNRQAVQTGRRHLPTSNSQLESDISSQHAQRPSLQRGE